MLTLIAQGKGTDEIVKFLDETVFKLASATKAALLATDRPSRRP